jgi:hypothetical protein
MRKDKDFYRDLKRCLKKAGNKRRRAFHKQNLVDNPEDAHLCDDFDYEGFASKPLNGMDHDTTRRKDDGQPTPLLPSPVEDGETPC